MSTPSVLKTFEITYASPDGMGEASSGKSLSFHLYMRHVRDCHRRLLEFLSSANLLDSTGISDLIADERKTIIECTDEVAARIKSLLFVESTQEASQWHALPGRKRAPVSQN